MKSKLFILAFIGFLFVACQPNAPKEPQIYSGDIVGYVGCYDERDPIPHDSVQMRRGLVIRTDTKDSLLTFSLDVDSFLPEYYVFYGTRSLGSKPLEHKFYYNVIDSTDDRYVRIWPIIESAEHWACRLPAIQVEIIFIK